MFASKKCKDRRTSQIRGVVEKAGLPRGSPPPLCPSACSEREALYGQGLDSSFSQEKKAYYNMYKNQELSVGCPCYGLG